MHEGEGGQVGDEVEGKYGANGRNDRDVDTEGNMSNDVAADVSVVTPSSVTSQ